MLIRMGNNGKGSHSCSLLRAFAGRYRITLARSSVTSPPPIISSRSGRIDWIVSSVSTISMMSGRSSDRRSTLSVCITLDAPKPATPREQERAHQVDRERPRGKGPAAGLQGALHEKARQRAEDAAEGDVGDHDEKDSCRRGSARSHQPETAEGCSRRTPSPKTNIPQAALCRPP